CSSYAGTNVLV
nr:immunoglobulin light chain junction region [Macaca mulatta]